MVNTKQIQIDGKQINIYSCDVSNMPVIYLNTFGNECSEVYQTLLTNGYRDFNLVTIGNLDWDHDMAPWDIPPISKDDIPCTGGADDHLKLLSEIILPKAESEINGNPPWRGLAGYSLAGLFAIYSIYRSDLFSRIASMSGSLWFPGFTEYVLTHEMNRAPKQIYLSLGDQESHTRNLYLKTVQDNTEKIADYYKHKGLHVHYELNHGNHFKDAAKRTATGIEWILKQ